MNVWSWVTNVAQQDLPIFMSRPDDDGSTLLFFFFACELKMTSLWDEKKIEAKAKHEEEIVKKGFAKFGSNMQEISLAIAKFLSSLMMKITY